MKIPSRPSHIDAPPYLAARYVTRQSDGVHVEARCTCGVKLEGVGTDESKALEELWAKFKTHTEEK